MPTGSSATSRTCARRASTFSGSTPMRPARTRRARPRGRGRAGVIGLFGGSFDPIHHGHLIVARVAAETLGLTQVRFVPARQQPFKVGRHGAGAADRAAMVEAAIAG